MDDILIAGTDGAQVLFCYAHMQESLQNYCLQIASEKVQKIDSYSYLGFKLYPNQITHQKFQIRIDNLIHYMIVKNCLVISIGLGFI